jgi:hypothetical protein
LQPAFSAALASGFSARHNLFAECSMEDCSVAHDRLSARFTRPKTRLPHEATSIDIASASISGGKKSVDTIGGGIQTRSVMNHFSSQWRAHILSDVVGLRPLHISNRWRF